MLNIIQLLASSPTQLYKEDWKGYGELNFSDGIKFLPQKSTHLLVSNVL